MSVYGRIFLATLGSALLLIGAFGFQYLGGLAPCEMCLWQRWPHAVAVLLGGLAMTVLWRQRRFVAVAGAAAMIVGTGIGAFHAGVEQGWWEGITTCATAQDLTLSADDLLAQITSNDTIVRCDEIPWSFLGLSMAAWNALISLGLAGIWVGAVVWWRMLEFGRQSSSSASQ